MTGTRFGKLAISILLGLFCAIATAQAKASIVIDLDFEFSGATSPSGTPPWLRATFTNQGGGVVRLLLENLLQNSTEFVSNWDFNLNTSLDPNLLVFSHISTVGTVGVPAITKDKDNISADGGGYYDFDFEFETSNTVGRFQTGDQLVYDISYSSPLDESDFAFLSAPHGGNGVHYSAAHVQGIPPSAANSGWIGGDDYTNPSSTGTAPVPEPASVAVWSLLVGIAAIISVRPRK